MLAYGPFDATVGSPERLSGDRRRRSKAAAAQLVLTGDGDGMLNAADLIAYADQVAPRAQFEALFEAARNEPDFVARREAVKAEHRKTHIATQKARGKPAKQAATEYDRCHSAPVRITGERTYQEPPPGHTLYRPDGKSFTVDDIQRDPDAFVDRACADPIEGMDYQTKKCGWIDFAGGEVVIYSRAHGDAFAYVVPIDISQTLLGERLRKLHEDAGLIVDGKNEDDAQAPRLADIPLPEGVDWMRPEGVLGEIVDYTLGASRWPNRPMAVATAIATLSAVCGRWLYSPTGAALGVYTCVLPIPGSARIRR